MNSKWMRPRDVAELAGVSPSTASNWDREPCRAPEGFPAARRTPGGRRVWLREEVMAWAREAGLETLDEKGASPAKRTPPPTARRRSDDDERREQSGPEGGDVQAE